MSTIVENDTTINDVICCKQLHIYHIENVTHGIFVAIPTTFIYSICIDSYGPQLSSEWRTFVAAFIENTTPVDLCIVPVRRNMMHLFPAIVLRVILISEALGILLLCLKRIREKLTVTSEEAGKFAVAVIHENSAQNAFISLIMQLILPWNLFTFFVGDGSGGDTRHGFNCNNNGGYGSPGEESV